MEFEIDVSRPYDLADRENRSDTAQIWRWTGFTGSGDPLKALEASHPAACLWMNSSCVPCFLRLGLVHFEFQVEFKVSGRGATSKGAQSGNGVVIGGAGDIGWINQVSCVDDDAVTRMLILTVAFPQQVTVDGDQSRSLAGQTTAETNGNNVLVTWCLPSGVSSELGRPSYHLTLFVLCRAKHNLRSNCLYQRGADPASVYGSSAPDCSGHLRVKNGVADIKTRPHQEKNMDEHEPAATTATIATSHTSHTQHKHTHNTVQ